MQQSNLPLFSHLDPSHPFELQAARQLVARAMRSLIVGQRITLDNAAALWLGERLLSLDPSGAAADLLAIVRSDCENAVVLDAFTSLHGLLAANVETEASPLQDRLDRMATLFDLSGAEKQILGITIRCSGFGLTSGIAAITKSQKTDYLMGGRDHLPVLTGLSQNRVDALLADDAPLFAHGLLTGSDCELGNTTMLALEAEIFDEQSLLATFVTDQAPMLTWDDYSHLHDQLVPVEHILRATCEQEIDGINILFHGVPGTGKTELAKLLAGRLDMPVVTLEGYEGRERRGRSPDLVGLFRARKHLVRLIDRAMLVIDEADDLLSGINDPLLSARPVAKLHIHESVERGARPTIWITNHPERLGASVLRRMTFAVDLRVPAKKDREHLLQRIFDRNSLALSAEDRTALAARYEAPPAIFENAAKLAAATGGGVPQFQAATSSILHLLGGETPPRKPAPTTFRLEHIHCREHLPTLLSALQADPARDFSMLLHGLQGTGKTAFARHLAEALGMELVELRSSDLLSKWHGETEQNIAAAFREADRRKAVLLIDEGEALLRSRASRTHAWEVSQLNELLTWLDAPATPVVVTLNDVSQVDGAALRRFVFKLEFLPLGRDQARATFADVFGLPLGLHHHLPEGLCLGDLAVVKRQLRYQPEADATEIIARLKGEVFRRSANLVQTGSRELSVRRH